MKHEKKKKKRKEKERKEKKRKEKENKIKTKRWGNRVHVGCGGSGLRKRWGNRVHVGRGGFRPQQPLRRESSADGSCPSIRTGRIPVRNGRPTLCNT